MQDTFLVHMDGLYSYAMVLTRNPAEAADLVQETYLRALKAQDSLRPDGNLKSWLFTILRNIWLNQVRHERVAPRIIELETGEGIVELAVETAKDPHAQYVSKIEQEQVRQAILQLPEEFREVVILREYEDLSYQEIANVLNCPAGTVMSRLARARSKLRALLEVDREACASNENRQARKRSSGLEPRKMSRNASAPMRTRE